MPASGIMSKSRSLSSASPWKMRQNGVAPTTDVSRALPPRQAAAPNTTKGPVGPELPGLFVLPRRLLLAITGLSACAGAGSPDWLGPSSAPLSRSGPLLAVKCEVAGEDVGRRKAGRLSASWIASAAAAASTGWLTAGCSACYHKRAMKVKCCVLVRMALHFAACSSQGHRRWLLASQYALQASGETADSMTQNRNHV